MSVRGRSSRIGAHVPVVTQFASAELVGPIVYEGFDPALDPAWATSGAPTVEDYATWCGRWCGLACLRMALLARDGTAPSLWDLLVAGLAYGTYVPRDDGSVDGMIYAPFATYVTEVYDLAASVHRDLPVDDLVALAADDRTLVIASVHREIRRPDRPSPGAGGHLVLVVDADPATGTVSFRNPSGHTPGATAATLPTKTFATYFAPRGIALTL